MHRAKTGEHLWSVLVPSSEEEKGTDAPRTQTDTDSTGGEQWQRSMLTKAVW